MAKPLSFTIGGQTIVSTNAPMRIRDDSSKYLASIENYVDDESSLELLAMESGEAYAEAMFSCESLMLICNSLSRSTEAEGGFPTQPPVPGRTGAKTLSADTNAQKALNAGTNSNGNNAINKAKTQSGKWMDAANGMGYKAKTGKAGMLDRAKAFAQRTFEGIKAFFRKILAYVTSFISGNMIMMKAKGILSRLQELNYDIGNAWSNIPFNSKISAEAFQHAIDATNNGSFDPSKAMGMCLQGAPVNGPEMQTFTSTFNMIEGVFNKDSMSAKTVGGFFGGMLKGDGPVCGQQLYKIVQPYTTGQVKSLVYLKAKLIPSLQQGTKLDISQAKKAADNNTIAGLKIIVKGINGLVKCHTGYINSVLNAAKLIVDHAEDDPTNTEGQYNTANDADEQRRQDGTGVVNQQAAINADASRKAQEITRSERAAAATLDSYLAQLNNNPNYQNGTGLKGIINKVAAFLHLPPLKGFNVNWQDVNAAKQGLADMRDKLKEHAAQTEAQLGANNTQRKGNINNIGNTGGVPEGNG